MSDYAIRPWMPTGNTVAIAGATTAANGVQIRPGGEGNEPGAAGGGPVQYRIHNSGSVYTYLGWGATNTAAQTASNTVAVDGTPSPALVLPPGAIECLTLPRTMFFAVKSASGTPVVYITPGKGV